MRPTIIALVLALIVPGAAQTQEPPTGPSQGAVPDRRSVVTRNVDYYGQDLQTLRDLSAEACARTCLNDPDCRAFTYNRSARVCFPKSGTGEIVAFEGADSGRVIETPRPVLIRAADRAAALDILSDDDIAAARAEAAALGLRHAGGAWPAAELLRAAQQAEDEDALPRALHWTGAALAQEDSATLWREYGRLAERRATQLSGADRQRMQRRAFLAAVNAWLRAGPRPEQSATLVELADRLEQAGRGADMIAPLRLAGSLGGRVDARLDDAIGKYGFRILGHSVESDLPAPRLCAEFSRDLRRAGQDYTPYVRLPDPRLAVEAGQNRICVTGLTHGERYRVTFREGLPAADGEALHRDVSINAYVRDRSPSVRFPGRAYVLPAAPGAALPVETVNLSELSLTLRRVSDRNLVRTLREDWFGRPVSGWEETRLTDGIAEQVWTGTATVGNELNADMTTRLPLGDALDGRPAGVYALTAGPAGSEIGEDGRATQWFIVSDIGLTTFEGSDGLTVAARSLLTADPAEGLRIDLVSRSNRVLAQARTDADGLARFGPGLMRGTDGAAPALITAFDDGAEDPGQTSRSTDMAFLSLTDPGFDLSDRGVAGREPAGPLDAFLTTDRGAYRAGEAIRATALLRDARADAVTGVPVTAILTRPDGVEHARVTSARGIDGGHVFSLPLSDTVPRGPWSLGLHADPDAAPLARQVVLVEDFVPERIDFDLTLPEGLIDPAEPPTLDIAARFLFGAPGAGLSIEGDVRLSTTRTLPAFPGYRFGRHDDPSVSRTAYLPVGAQTDAQGRASLPLPLPQIDALHRPMEAEVAIRLSEASNRPVERRITRPVAPDGPVIGIRPGFDDTLPEGAEATFDVIGLGADRAPQDMAVRWRVNRVTTRYQWYELYGNWNWEPVTTRETIASGEGRLGQPLRVTAAVDWGRHELVVERTDGAYTAASVGFDAGWYAPADAADSPDMLELSLDAAAYAIGDTATLRMVPRAAGTALVTIMADRLISLQAVAVTEGENTLTLPVTEEWGAGVYVSAQVIRPAGDAGTEPTRALGLAHAGVDPGPRAMPVTIVAPDEAAPRETLTGAVRVDAPDGETAHVTVAAVDLGILNLTGFDSPDPAGHYFGQRRLGVEIRDLYGRLIDGRSGALGQVRSGGDAAGAMQRRGPPPTERLVALFDGPVTVEDGQASFAFDMPDFNGTVRLMAVAWSASGVGAAEADVLVRDPVVVSAALPRFLSPGDETRLGLTLTHAKGPTGDMALSVSAPGLSLGDVPATVTLGQGADADVSIPLTARGPGDHGITVVLTTPDGQRLTKSLVVGVRRTDPAIARTRYLSLDPGQSLTVDGAVLDGLHRAEASVLLSAGPLARFDVAGRLAALDRYPYGCTEQVTSRALPLLYLSSLAEPLGLGGAAEARAQIDAAIGTVLTRQAGSGGFGLWRAGSGDTWLDAYVTDFLGRARSAGHAVPDRAYALALDNLANRIAYAADFDSGGEDIAYALFVLAREGRAAMGDLRYYADEKADNFGSALALAQLGAALAAYGDPVRADALFARAERRTLRDTDTDRVWRADYGTALRDAAGVLSLAVEARSDAVDRGAMADRLATASRRLSPQEQAWALLAANALLADPSASGLMLDGAPMPGAGVQRLAGEGLGSRSLTNAGPRPIDVTLTSIGVPSGDTAAGGAGFAIDRTYYTLDGEAATFPVAAGTRLVTVLTIRPSEGERARLMIEDPLPAGLEIDNPSLIRAGDLAALDWLETVPTENAEFLADRFRAAVTRDGTDPIRVAYMVRAVSPGTFHHPAALVEAMYRPDYRATTASGRITVLP